MEPVPCVIPIGREEQIARLGAETFDLAVIGGGISGAAIARDGALRGLKVALVDRGDFAGATSSHSSKLIHGGLRYLPQGQIRLVYQALRERERLRRLTAPHLVGPIQFLFPFYTGRHPGRLAVSAGLLLYDLFAWTPRVERHRRLSTEVVQATESGLAVKGMRGGAIYYDGWGDDARLTLENIVDTALHGGAVANYTEVESLAHEGGKIVAAIVRDRESGEQVVLRARCFVNATGPWIDRLRGMDDPAARQNMRLTKGVHLVVSAARLKVRHALVLTDMAGRIIFVMPHDGWTLIGTTDTDYHGDPADVRVEARDVDYLIGVVNQALPGTRLEPQDVTYSFAGLRVLPHDGGQKPSAVAREEVISESASGLISVGGGKLTSHRGIGEQIGAKVLARLGQQAGLSPTRTLPLPGARAIPGDVVSEDRWRRQCPWLAGRYGSRAGIVAAIARERPELAVPIATDARAIGAEVVFAIHHEWARTVSDFLLRRTAMAWRNPPAAIASAVAVGRIMADELGWDAAKTDEQVAAFREHMRQATMAERSADSSDGEGVHA